MLALSVPLRSAKDEREVEMEGFDGEFPDFCAGSLLDSIDFDDLFVGISDGDVLPDLENLAEFTLSGGDESDANASTLSVEENSSFEREKLASSETVVMGEDVAVKEADEGVRKSMAHSKNPSGKRKVKVDWTPELHRRFVQAVEQLGVDKAVPSRILDLMGIDCLTRHNIASHLQKYRSHRKHLLAREAEAASWSQRRQMYGAAGGGRITGKRDHHHHHHNNVKPWIAPTMGFPPVTPMPPHFRPLHVWGHPSVDQSMINMWPKHLTPSPPPPPPQAWPSRHSSHPLPPPVPVDNSFWISHPSHIQTPATPCFPPHLPPSKFPALPIPGIPPPPMYKVEQGGLGMPTVAAPGQTLSPQPPSDVHPSKESVDAAIGDVLSKPWLPLPLGLKPPSLTGVMVELQRQGISKIPPNSTTFPALA